MKNTKEVVIQAIAASMGASVGLLIASVIFAPAKTKRFAKTMYSIRPERTQLLKIVADAAIIAAGEVRLFYHFERYREIVREERDVRKRGK